MVIKLIVFSVSFIVLILGLFLSIYQLGDVFLPEVTEYKASSSWKVIPNPSPSKSVDSIRFSVPENSLKILKDKLASFALPNSVKGGNFQYGINSEFFKELMHYWMVDYNWKKWEDVLNGFKNFFTEVQGLKIHLVQYKPIVQKDQKLVPLLLLHGWPGSFFEFYKLIPALQKVSAKSKLQFHIICPSLPGYGWSEPSEKSGMDMKAISSLMFDLLDRLNVSDPVVIHGGDWGSFIGSTMAKLNPKRVAGYHTNFVLPPMYDYRYYAQLLIGSILPRPVHFLNNDELDMVYPYKEHIHKVIQRMGYFWLQSTRPDTIGIALSNSPVGLAAYITEKFLDWSTTLSKFQNSPDGDLKNCKISRDEILTNIMIYYITGTITSSMRLYHEVQQKRDDPIHKLPIQVPTALLDVPFEIVRTPYYFAKLHYRDIRQYTSWQSNSTAGHFVALQYPQELAMDIWNFVLKLYK